MKPQDLRYGIRALRKSPGYALAAIATLALGIGANSAIFSVVNAVLLKPLPYPDPDRLLFINESLPKAGYLNVSWPDFLDWRAQNQVFERLAVFQPNRLAFYGSSEPRLIPVAYVSPDFFPLLGARPMLGRIFPEGSTTQVVVSNSFWRNQLNGDPAIIGKPITIGNGSIEVAGVLAPEFTFHPWDFDVYLPIAIGALDPSWTRSNHPGLVALASLRPGISLARARADMRTIMDRLARTYPQSNRDESAVLTPFAERLTGPVRRELLMLLAAVGFVLLMACANVAHLALARATGRQREIAIRAALGAGRVRLISQTLSESLLLSLSGGALGLLLANWGISPMTRLYPSAVPGLREAHLEPAVLLYTFAISLATSLLFGLAPMWQAGCVDINLTLKESGAGLGSRRGRWFRSVLFATEIAIAVVLAVGSGLLLRSLAAVLNVNPGFRPDHLLALDVTRTYGARPAQNYRFFAQAIDQVSQLPGVVSASAVMCPPLGGTSWTSPYQVEGAPPVDAMEQPWTALNMVMRRYFETMGTPLVAGRYFGDSDYEGSAPAAILSESFARRLWPNKSPIGRRLRVKYASHEILEVVGVVADMKQYSLEAPNTPELYLPAAQMPVSFMTIMVRTAGEPETLARAATAAIQGLDRNQPVARITPMTRALSASLARRTFSALLLSLFGGLALVLAAIGVGGVMAYSVAQRTREIGIRMALGAQRGQVLRDVIGHGLRLTSIGIFAGAAAAWMLTRLLEKLLFGVQSHDALTFTLVAAVLAAVATGACALPARRASRIDPVSALRYE
jgi:putative ABC transport system permease protein